MHDRLRLLKLVFALAGAGVILVIGLLLAMTVLTRSARHDEARAAEESAPAVVAAGSRAGVAQVNPTLPLYDYDPAVEPQRYAREVDVVATSADAPAGVARALYAAFITDAPADDQQCQQAVRVFRSTDDGQTWQDDGLPAPDPPPPPCDQPREGCRTDQLMDPILTMAADGYPRLGLIWIHGCGSTIARAVRSAEGWSKPQSLLPIQEGMGATADGSYALATADGTEYYSWSVGLPVSFGGQIVICPHGDCSAPITATINSRVEFGGLKLYAHPAGGAAVVYSKGLGVRTMLFYRHLWPDGMWETDREIPLTDLYPTSVVAIGLRAFSLAFVPGHPEEAIATFIVNSGTQLGERASYLAYRRTTDGGATWSGTIYLDGSQSVTGSGEPQYEIVQFPILAASSARGRVGLLYQMRDVHASPSPVHTCFQEYGDGAFTGRRLILSHDRPSLYPALTGAWRMGEYNGLAALPIPCYLGAWQSVAEVGGILQGRILTRLICQGGELPPYRNLLPFASNR